ncbi:hypothetical protein PF006_g9790 [Phytophthora fragariae]|uniref:Uncharacterized protein n=1 Tax=Phytophthora fragariae TaxID=53985 RepID=A0A6A3U2V9_9STRA|nr:hypothetical protein PF006_g9790 [Phytophthora fragariae]
MGLDVPQRAAGQESAALKCFGDFLALYNMSESTLKGIAKSLAEPGALPSAKKRVSDPPCERRRHRHAGQSRRFAASARSPPWVLMELGYHMRVVVIVLVQEIEGAQVVLWHHEAARKS